MHLKISFAGLRQCLNMLIIHLFPYHNDGLVKPPLVLGYRRVSTTQSFIWIQLLIYVQNQLRVWLVNRLMLTIYTHMALKIKFSQFLIIESLLKYIYIYIYSILFFGHNIETFLCPRCSTFDPALHLRRLSLPAKSRKHTRHIIHVLQRFIFHQLSKLFDIKVCVWWKTRHQILWIKAIFTSCYNAIWYNFAYCCKEKGLA